MVCIRRRKELIHMDSIFAEMFAKQPDEIINNDYFFHTWHEEGQDGSMAAEKGITVKEIHEWREKGWFGYDSAPGTFRFCWDDRTHHGEHGSDAVAQWMRKANEDINSKANGVFGKIAASGKPVMDISSSVSFGLIPLIVQLNQQAPCMATDIYAHLIKCLRIFVNSDLSEYNISLASFDNYEMPIKDNSLDYITSTFGISDSGSRDKNNLPVDSEFVKNKPISEVYRVLKPGGCFVTVERNIELKFDLAKTKEAYNRRGKLFGDFDYREMEETQNKWGTDSWRNQFTKAGFEIEIEEKYPEKGTRDHLLYFLDMFTLCYRIRKWKPDGFQFRNAALALDEKVFDEILEDYGIEFYQGQIFYVLRKPIDF